MSWLLNLAYLLTVALASPVLLYRMLVLKKYREGWGQKFLGLLPERAPEDRASDRPCLWVHAVSVGEVLQIEPLLEALKSRRPELEFVISTTTSTGYALACKKFSGSRVCYFPLDFSWAVRRAIARIRPSAIVLVELELWPNFVFEAHRAGIPLALANARITERSFRHYRFVRPVIARLLSCLEVIAAQNKTYADRLLALGAPRNRVRITGSIKFDRVTTDRRNTKTLELRKFFGLGDDERVFIAGSTQASEEELALDTYRELISEIPDLRLVIVPRHKERFDEVAKLIERRGLPLVRRSIAAPSSKPTTCRRSDGEAVGLGNATTPLPILLLDTLGELSACWGLADVAFVGGSLTNRGGQNMIEPAGYGAAILFGPNTWNFRDVVEILLGHGAARVVLDGKELTAAVRTLLQNREEAARLGSTARELVLAQQGATARTSDLLIPLVTSPKMHHSAKAA
jgi:3-deoxy-D-manno-octulosonic-acid transferase